MTASIDIPFAIGQVVWRACATPIEKRVKCPECAGTRVVTMLLGNGDQHTLGCSTCGPGYEPPTGTVRAWDYDTVPERFTCTDLDISGGKVRYSLMDVKYLYEDENACRVHCNVLNEEHKKQREERDILNLSSKRQDLAFSVYYWRSNVRKLKKELATAEAQLDVCKGKETK